MDRSRPLSTHTLGALRAGKDPAGSRTRAEGGRDYTFFVQVMFKGPVDHEGPGE